MLIRITCFAFYNRKQKTVSLVSYSPVVIVEAKLLTSCGNFHEATQVSLGRKKLERDKTRFLE